MKTGQPSIPVACTVPLKGSQLIEAAAGTGKTWTIASLVLRLVLTEDGPTGHPMDIPDILVLTFTRAATKELVDRIRRRLLECRAAFEVEPSVPHEVDDKVIDDLLRRVGDKPQQRLDSIARLDRAIASMDAAAVTTIDAWVQRMLREQVRPAGAEPLGTIIDDDEGWVRRAVLDYWRQEIYPLDDATMAYVAEAYPDPQALMGAVRPLLGRRGASSAAVLSQQPLRVEISATAHSRAERLVELKKACSARMPDIRAWLEAAFNPPSPLEGAGSGSAGSGRNSKSKSILMGNKLRADWVETPLMQLEEWALGEASAIEGWTTGKVGKTVGQLLPEGLLASHREEHRPADAPAWSHELKSWIDEVAAWPPPAEAVLSHALPAISHRLLALKTQAGTWSFDDLLNQMVQALEADPALGPRLSQVHPVALIDEFQDTSSAQLRMFDLVYRLADQDPSCALLLIGDPKQSIYRFRGADIHSYLRARRLCQDRIHTLGVNFRSTAGLVEAVNDLFERAESRADDHEGAFLHGPEVPFTRALASASAIDPLAAIEGLAEGASQCATKDLNTTEVARHPVIVAWTESLTRSSAQARDVDAAIAAEHIVTLLNDRMTGRVAAPGGEWQRLRPRDCCVLVRSGVEAAAMRRALAIRGVASAYLSERDYVFHSPQAPEMLDLLRAMDQPSDIAAARRVWASGMVSLDFSTLIAQSLDHEFWDARLERLARWRDLWRQRGVLAAVRQFVVEEGVGLRALADPEGGERRLTNILHLAEWLQEISEQTRDTRGLIEALSAAISSKDQRWRAPAGSQAHVLRLESESDVVQIVTIHKSKGLQYPVVFMPFASAVRPSRGGEEAAEGEAAEHGDDVALALSERESADSSERATDEDLEGRREAMRLFYVGATRAVHQLWIGASPRALRAGSSTNEWHTTALGHLVSGPSPRSGPEVVADLQALFADWSTSGRVASRLDVLNLGEEAQIPCTRFHACDAGALPRASRAAVTPLARVDTSWRITSYSALVKGAGESEAMDGAVSDWSAMRWDEPARHGAGDGAGEPPSSAGGAWHALKSSAELGQFVHELLERSAEQRFNLNPTSSLMRELESTILNSAWAAQAQQILEWVRAVATQALLPWGVPLSGLRVARAELEFWLPLQMLDVANLDDWCRRQIWPQQVRPALRNSQLQGLLMGYADLVFEHQGRYAVLDYKSNRLGSGPSAYTPQAMAEAMLAHRYDVQGAIYLLALHRLLKRRLGDAYRLEQHLGPAQFFFLRGVDHPSAGLVDIQLNDAAMAELDALVGYAVAPLDGRAA